MEDCIFCLIAEGKAKCHKLWENDEHMAFLTPFPNTEGFSVVIPKIHYPSYAFEVPDDVLNALTIAAKKTGKMIDAAFEDVGRTGMIFEGFGVNHLHAKLFPMHGTGDMSKWKPVKSDNKKFFEQYEGYISSHDYERMDNDRLEEIAKRISNFA